MNWKHLFSISIYLVHIFLSCVPGRESISSISGYHLNNCGQRGGREERVWGWVGRHTSWLVPPLMRVMTPVAVEHRWPSLRAGIWGWAPRSKSKKKKQVEVRFRIEGSVNQTSQPRAICLTQLFRSSILTPHSSHSSLPKQEAGTARSRPNCPLSPRKTSSRARVYLVLARSSISGWPSQYSESGCWGVSRSRSQSNSCVSSRPSWSFFSPYKGGFVIACCAAHLYT